jgi:ATP-dependent Lhr-like helicase
VVSSTSLELGIDIGGVEGVVLVHPPGGVIRLLQRVGRGGHEPGRPRRGLVLTTSPAELLEAAVTAASCRLQVADCRLPIDESIGNPQFEPLRVPSFPLDVLCQQLLGMAAHDAWSPNDAFALVRRAYPYRDLPRSDFDGCMDYLSGRRRDGRPWLPARLRWDGDVFTIRDERTARLLRQNLGTILAEDTCPVTIAPANALEEMAPGQRVGEVSHAFADRLQPGARFLLDGRCLELRHTVHDARGPALLVEEVAGRPAVPRWTGDGWPLAASLARRLYLLRTQAAEALRDGPEALAELLRRDYGLGGRAVAVLAAHFQRQECVSEIPDATVCLVEAVRCATGVDYYVHTPVNRAANDVLARLAVFRLARDRGRAAASVVADLGFALFCRGGAELRPDDFRGLLAAPGFDADLTAAFAGSVTLRERFRRVALTGLMLLRNPLGRRRRVGGHDWAERRLFEQVSADDPDFVLLRQAWREVREECCDGEAARAFLEELPRKTLRCRWLPCVSPFAESWTQLAAGPAEAVESPAEALQRLHAALTGGESSQP